MNGHSVKDHLGRSVLEMYPEWFPLYEPLYLRALEGEAISGVEISRPSLHADDPDKKLLVSYQPAWDEADEVIGISVSILDVTDHRRAEDALLGAESLEFAFEVNPEMPWVMDGEGNNLQVSSRWVQATPLGKDKTRNLHWLEALHPEDLASTMRVMKQALRTGAPIDVEYRVLSVDGEWRWMRSRGSPRYAPSGEITRWYGSVEDIHDRKLEVQTALDESGRQDLEDRKSVATGILIADSLQSLCEYPPDAA